MKTLVGVVMLIGMLSAGPLDIVQTVKLIAGTQPMCVLDKNNNLHVVYKSNGIQYMRVLPDGSMQDKAQVSSSGDNPHMTVDAQGNIHVVWDTHSQSSYKKRTGKTWGSTINLPKFGDDRNWFPYVAADKNGVAYWAVWGISGSGNSSYFGYIEGSTPKNIFNRGENRPGNLLGPTDRDSGDGQVYAFPGEMKPAIKKITGGTVSDYATMAVYSGKSHEGYCPFWIEGKPAIVFSEVLSGTAPFGVCFNEFPRNKASKIHGPHNEHDAFARGVYDEVNKLVYALWHEGGTGYYGLWDVQKAQASEVKSLGKIQEAARGHGAGGIAYTGKGGVYLVVSQGGTLARITVGDNKPGILTIGNNGLQQNPITIVSFSERYDVFGRKIILKSMMNPHRNQPGLVVRFDGQKWVRKVGY